MNTRITHLGIGPTEAEAIAEAVRGWMNESFIKQLEAEVARLKGLKSAVPVEE